MGYDDSHLFELCRALYQTAREKGCPVVHVVDLGGGTMCAETADSKILVEDISGCCKWAIKHEVAQMWLEENQDEN
jgi:hypothetical protein